jgi:thiamine kinase-like enzyme
MTSDVGPTDGKRIGEAIAEDEQALEAAIRRVPHWPLDSVRYQAVSGGITNSNWRVSAGGGDYFVKIPGRGTEMFIDRSVALEASRKAYQFGVGPAVHEWLASDGIEITDFMTGRRPCGLGDFSNAQLRGAVVDQYRRFHAAPKLTLTKTVFDMIDEHAGQVAALGGWKPPDADALHWQVMQARQAITASGFELTPCFNDPMPGNFMVADDRSVMLIDYEYASNNDRAYDLGAWFGEMFFTPDQETAAIERYAGGPAAALTARASLYKALADIKWATWSMVQEQISTLDFDFRKYGVWKYLRARSVMNDPRWPVWLAAA